MTLTEQEGFSSSVLISTYNWPAALEKVLWGFFAQTRRDFELIIADDGSGSETAELITRMARRSPVPVTHVWQPDEGFAKCRILNKALALARGQRIVVTDGDCVVRGDFVDTHIREARPGRFLSGSYFKQNRQVSEAIDEAAVASQDCFTARWLLDHGAPSRWRMVKLGGPRPVAWAMDRLFQANPSWNGHSASCLRSEALSVNGFDEEMGYGGEDVEFGYRLNNTGLTARRIRYATVVLHLFHERGYVSPEILAFNREVKDRTRAEKRTRTRHGVDRWIGPGGEARLAPQDRVSRFGA
ncbi:glycosyltransferase family 2 protein [Paracoccus marinaquae]|uniref:Glycosyltransferase family 2 protein n=1 Tax=Paracoccus marinaquae TaxID=2841926 RepID=A0ABS6AK73_9RHOB|nr:glycosyltransferase family 2 protein [Paracoccus marinaquae]MBU3030904.1 glycosyltransferase family 2 protein [Paracoccus marinaquae]